MRQRNPKNEFWKQVSEEGLLENQGIDRKTKCGEMPSYCSIWFFTVVLGQDVRVTGRIKQRRLGPQNEE